MTNNELHVFDDGAFSVERTQWGTFRSHDRDGHELITSLTHDQCVDATRFFLCGRQEGWDSLACSTYGGEVGGKL